MQLWFHEREPGYGFEVSYQFKETLHREQSPYQHITIVDTESFGRMLILDNCVQVTERDEFFYHEMLVHPAMCTHPNPQRVLVIGGGDGGTVRELLRHPHVQIDMVEIDEAVVRACQKHLPTMSCGLVHPRVSLHFEDGVAFMEDHQQTYDLIFVDSTDPEGLAEGLITSDFYNTCKKALRSPGAVVLQSESPLVHYKWIQQIHGNLKEVFRQAHLYLTPILFYPTGLWSFTFASDDLHPLHNFSPERAAAVQRDLLYYNATVHPAAFALPNFVQRTLAGESRYPQYKNLGPGHRDPNEGSAR